MSVAKVLGYTEQPPQKVALVNDNKKLEEALLRRLDDLRATGDIDARWMAVAKTHFEEGFMALNRAIFQPQRVDGDVSGSN